MHLQVGGFSPGDPQLSRVWAMLAEAGAPVVVHAGHAPVATPHTGPGPVAEPPARHPRLTAVIAHLGAPDYEEFLRLSEERSLRELGRVIEVKPLAGPFFLGLGGRAG